MRKIVFAVVGFLVAMAPTAAHACGSLIAPNGAVRLVRTATFVAYHDGVERYITNFEFEGTPTSFGSIIPLPGRPSVAPEKAGEWTLQRLDQEVRPQLELAAAQDGRAFASADQSVEVIFESQIDSLNVRVLEGGGAEVAEWATEQGFVLSDDAPKVLDRYSRDVSPYFAAVEFDAELAATTGVISGDGVPVMFEIPLDEPWVPLEILSVAKPDFEIVEADIYVLTDIEPSIHAGPGVDLVRSEWASELLLDDLRSDERMEWVPETAWFSYLTVATEAADLDFDLRIDATRTPRETRTELATVGAILERVDDGGDAHVLAWLLAGVGVATAALALVVAALPRRSVLSG